MFGLGLGFEFGIGVDVGLNFGLDFRSENHQTITRTETK